MCPARFSILLSANFLKVALPALLLVFVTGCGFQLRSSDVSSLGVISIRGADAASDVGRALADELALYDVTVNQPGEESVAVVLDERTSTRRRVSTSSNIDAAEYRIAIEVLVSVHRGESVLIAPVTLVAERYYDVDETNLSGSVEEQEIMMREIREELAGQIIHMLSSIPDQG